MMSHLWRDELLKFNAPHKHFEFSSFSLCWDPVVHSAVGLKTHLFCLARLWSRGWACFKVTRTLTPLSWHRWGSAGRGRTGRYQTDTWLAAEAAGSQEGGMCSVTAAHIIAPRVGPDRLQRSPPVRSVVVPLDVQHVASLHRSKLSASGVWIRHVSIFRQGFVPFSYFFFFFQFVNRIWVCASRTGRGHVCCFSEGTQTSFRHLGRRKKLFAPIRQGLRRNSGFPKYAVYISQEKISVSEQGGKGGRGTVNVWR